MDNGKVLQFGEIKKGLYILGFKSNKQTIINYSESYLSSVEENEKDFTIREVKAARNAVKLYHNINMPGYG